MALTFQFGEREHEIVPWHRLLALLACAFQTITGWRRWQPVLRRSFWSADRLTYIWFADIGCTEGVFG